MTLIIVILYRRINMKGNNRYKTRYLLLVLLNLTIAQSSCSYQSLFKRDLPPVLGFEYYDSFTVSGVFIDYLPRRLVPDIFIKEYYSKLQESECKKEQSINSLTQSRSFHMVSKKSKKGFLRINEEILRFVVDNGYIETPSLRLSYIMDDSFVESREAVLKMINLRNNQIASSYISFEQSNNLVIAKITTRSITHQKK